MEKEIIELLKIENAKENIIIINGSIFFTRKNINDLIPDNFSSGKNLRRSGTAGVFSGSLELVKEGNLVIKQDKLYDNIYIKEK